MRPPSRGRGRSSRRALELALALGLTGGSCAAPGTGTAGDPWEAELRAFSAADAKAPPPPGGVVFVGSSSIRLWDLERSFPGSGFLNRGFGGSHYSDCARLVSRLVHQYAPRTVVVYAGDNDIAAGKSPATVLGDAQAFAAGVHARLPATRIIFLSIKPSPDRWR